MKITLTDTPLLSTQQIGELASGLDALHSRVIKAIERLNKDVTAKKTEIASRWKSSTAFSGADVARFAQTETLSAIGQIKDNSRAEIDGLLKQTGAPHAQLVAQRPFYDSPAKVLARAQPSATPGAPNTSNNSSMPVPPNSATWPRSQSAPRTFRWLLLSCRCWTRCPARTALSALLNWRLP